MLAHVKERVETPKEGGIYIYFKGVPYPRKGWPTIQSTETINIVKKITIFTFRNWFNLTKKNIERYIQTVEYVFDNPFKKYLVKHSMYHKEQYYTKFSREFRKFAESMLTDLHINIRLGEIFTMILELDDAYRYRIQDIFSETSKDVLTKRPVREMTRLLKIYQQRDGETTRNKFKVFTKFAWLLLIPRIRKAFVKAVQNADFENLQFDNSDKYVCLNFSEYMHMGFTDQQKLLRYVAHHPNGLPPTTKLVH